MTCSGVRFKYTQLNYLQKTYTKRMYQCQRVIKHYLMSYVNVPMQCDEDDVCSVVSSCVGSVYEVCHANDDGEEDNSNNEEELNTAKLLKGVENVSMKPMSTCILKDV